MWGLRLPAWAWKSLGAALALAGAFLAGRWSIPRGKPVQLVVGPAAPLPERNLSPVPEVRTVIVTRTVPGLPAPPPVPVPADLGQQLQTTTTALPVLPGGAVLHDALFGQVEGSRLTLRSVEWADSPAGRVPLDSAETVTATTTLKLPASPASPRWGLAALPYLDRGRIRSGVLVEHYQGPLTVGGGYLNRQLVGLVGFNW
ncbi:MAG TPA: hypothetical protein VFT46_06210 [Holophagaceae bacterium]|nr:hypothetical protein [Holophagaceae bacterium]